MSFSIEKLFVDVFAPQGGDTLAIMYDFPHGEIPDTQEWRERRQMAEDWHQRSRDSPRSTEWMSTLSSNMMPLVYIIATYQSLVCAKETGSASKISPETPLSSYLCLSFLHQHH